MAEWFEDESFWREVYPYTFSKERFDASMEEVEKIVGLTGIDEGAVLDLCCGPGRHSVEFARRGFSVTGVDRSGFLLKKAKEKANAAEVAVEWVRQDMRDFVRPGSFDLVINMFTAFGYFYNKEEDLKVLKNVYASLEQEGVFMIDVMGKERLARIFQPTVSDLLPGGSLLVQRHEVFDDWTRIRNQWILIREEEAKSFFFHHILYSGQELKDRLARSGFRDIRLFGDLNGNEYGVNAKRLIAVARKG